MFRSCLYFQSRCSFKATTIIYFSLSVLSVKGLVPYNKLSEFANRTTVSQTSVLCALANNVFTTENTIFMVTK